MESDRGSNFESGNLRGLALIGENEGGVRFVREAGRMVPDDGELLGWKGDGFESFGGVGSS
jgi:hypothetical protein